MGAERSVGRVWIRAAEAMTRKYGNETCMTCGESWNALNGRWCGLLKHYVEYADRPLCGQGNSTGLKD